MLLNELFGRKKEPVRGDVTAEERETMARVFGNPGNSKLKKGDEFLFPQNVTLVYKNARFNVYKEDGKLMASMGIYSDEDGPGNPRKSPIKTTDVQFDSEDSMERIKAQIDGKKE